MIKKISKITLSVIIALSNVFMAYESFRGFDFRIDEIVRATVIFIGIVISTKYYRIGTIIVAVTLFINVLLPTSFFNISGSMNIGIQLMHTPFTLHFDHIAMIIYLLFIYLNREMFKAFQSKTKLSDKNDTTPIG